VIGVFFFEIDPASETTDQYLWVVVGDVPPAYLVCDNAKTASAALERYSEEMESWIEAAAKGESVEDLIPVLGILGTTRLPPSPETIEMLRKRLMLIRRDLIPLA
jgi:hypothetical protein